MATSGYSGMIVSEGKENRTKKILLCIALLSIALHAATDQVVAVEDVSGGPISFSGSVHFQESADGQTRSRDGEVKGTNTSSREIIAISATVNATGGVIYHTHDFFTKKHGLMPGDSFFIPVVGMAHSDSPISEEVPPSAKATLVFVQFADGTFWGDQKAIDKITANRQQSEAMLRNLLDIYHTQGEKAFVNALKAHESGIAHAMQEHTPAHPDAFAVHLLDHYNQFGATATIENRFCAGI